MTIHQEILALVGKDIEFLKGVEEYVDEVDTGMRATVTRISDDMNENPDDPCLQIHFTFAKFEDYNKGFELAQFYDKDGEPTLTSREAGYYEVETSIYVGSDWEKCLKLVDPAALALMALFMVDKEAQPDITYVGWLETLALAAMPHLKSDG